MKPKYPTDRTGWFLFAVLVVTHVVIVYGVLTHGISFLVDAIPMPGHVVRVYLTVQALLLLFASAMIFRNIVRFREHWTWQELAMSRGIFFFSWGGGIGSFARAYVDNPTLTLGSPLVGIGILLILYGVLDNPVRFKEDDR